ncbi:primosomal replication protein N [Thiohalorhabdus sp.]|uniref:primosomal replication protein N n=1 Tax=Thiohalorhabdus sp. TaxID=3094134 RepID=UPI002FC361BA
MSDPLNRVTLEGEVHAGLDERWTPAGLPIARFPLEHWSRVSVAGLERTVACRITVVALGEDLAARAKALPAGGHCRVEGVLAQRVRRRQGEETVFGRLELHAESLAPVAPPQATSE